MTDKKKIFIEFAKSAMNGLISNSNGDDGRSMVDMLSTEKIVEMSFDIAEGMMDRLEDIYDDCYIGELDL